MAWQTLRGPHEEAGNDLSQPAAVAAVLTSQRLLVLSPELRILVAAPAQERVSSALWLGPALLYTGHDHQVWRSSLLTAMWPASQELLRH